MNQTSLPDKAGVIMFPPLLYLLVLVLGITVSNSFPIVQPLAGQMPVGTLLVFAGTLIVVLAARQLNKHNTTINPSGATTAIVDGGIFRLSRNPMYLSFTLMYIGISMLLTAWFNGVLLIPLLLLVQEGIIKREERYLLRKFGDRYAAYRASVRRWF